jgi:lincosamide nucleotidyltransferase A/C/D/E
MSSSETNTSPPQMSVEDVVALYDLLLSHRIDVWIDGGWGVDALLRRQTRPHADLDVAIRHSEVPLLRRLLEARGYRDVPRDDTWECNFVLGDAQGRLVDVHTFELDAEGNNVFGCEYRAEHLTGVGLIGAHEVRCIAADWLVKFHTGYPLDENDFEDVRALCEHFGIAMPEEHEAHWRMRAPPLR